MSDIEGLRGVVIITVVSVFIAFVLGMVVGSNVQRRHYRAEAIEAGVAEYRCDPETGVVEFSYRKGTP